MTRSLTKEEIAGWVHDVRNPLSAVAANLDFLRTATQSDDARDAVSEARTMVRVAEVMLSNLAQANDARPGTPRRVDVGGMMAQAIEQWKPYAAMKTVTLVATSPEAAVAFVDEELMRLLVNNMVLQTTDLAAPGSTVSLSASMVSGSGLHCSSQCVLTPGRDAQGHGRGLGLATIALLAERINGQYGLGIRGKELSLDVQIPLPPTPGR